MNLGRREWIEQVIRTFARRGVWVILGVGLVVRLPGLATKPLWYDEAFSVLFARAGLPAMLAGTFSASGASPAEIHPLLYYALLGVWGSLFGIQGAAVRLLSVAFGLAGLVAAYLLARRLFSERLGLVCGLLLALSPMQVHYAQEVRMYSLLAFLLLAATLCLHHALHGNGWKAWAAFALLSAAAQYTHNLAAFYLVPLALTPIWSRKWKPMLHVCLASALAFLLYLPWLVVVASQIARIGQTYWIARPGAAEMVRTLLLFCSSLPQPAWALPIVLAASVLILATASLALIRAWLSHAADSVNAFWLAYLSVTPPLLLLLVSQRLPVYVDRALLPSAGAFTLWVGWALWSGHLSRPLAWAGRLAVMVAVVAGLLSYYGYRGFPYAPFAEVGAYLREMRGLDEVIVHSNKLSAVPGRYYTPDLPQEFVADPPDSGSDTLAPATQAALGMAEQPTVADAVGQAGGVWLVMFTREAGDYQAAGQPAPPTLSWLDANFSRQEERVFGDLLLLHFRSRHDS